MRVPQGDHIGPPEHLEYGGLRVGHGGQVREGGLPVPAHHPVDLVLEPPLHLVVRHQEQDGPLQGGGDRLQAGREHVAHHLVELLVWWGEKGGWLS